MVYWYAKAELMNWVCVRERERERERESIWNSFAEVMKPKRSRFLTASSSSTGGSSLNKIESTVAKS